MKKFALGFIALALMVVTTGSTASAQPVAGGGVLNEDWLDKNMGFGIGAGSGIVLNGMNTGLSVRFFPVESFGLELVLGGGRDRVTTTTPATATTPETKTFVRTSHFDLSFLGEFRFLRSNRASLSGYAGLGISMIGAGQSFASQLAPGQFVDGSDTAVDVAIEIGLRGEVFLYKYFSIFGRIGININPHTDKEAPEVTDPQTPVAEDPFAPSTGGAEVRFFDAGNLLGQFGFTVWFN